nr:site-specific integrase [Ruegeria arenilitoris]
MSWEGIDLRLDPSSPSWPRLIRALQEASVEATEALRKRNRGDVVPTPEAPCIVAESAQDAPLLSTAIKLWSDEKSRGAWSPKVRDDHLAWTDLFIEIAGDRPITTYRKEDARAFKSVLMKLPANSRKKRETRGLPANVAAEKAERLGLEPMSASTVNKALNRVGAFWNWAEGHFDDLPTGLMKGLKIKTAVSPRDQRDAFALAQMQKLFSSPLFTACRSERYCSEPGLHLMTETARFWLPLLGLFTGARLNELCQLATDDVREEAGIAYLDITNEGEGQSVKTNSGKRRIPIHSQLISLGFNAFVSRRRTERSHRLFPEMRKDASGYYSGNFSKFFSRYLERIGVKTAKTSFHSFRHNFEDACRNGEVPSNIMDALQGHAERGMAGRYGDGRYRIDLLKENIERVEYPGLDLSKAVKFQRD